MKIRWEGGGPGSGRKAKYGKAHFFNNLNLISIKVLKQNKLLDNQRKCEN